MHMHVGNLFCKQVTEWTEGLPRGGRNGRRGLPTEGESLDGAANVGSYQRGWLKVGEVTGCGGIGSQWVAASRLQ